MHAQKHRVEGAVIVVTLGVTVNQTALTMEQLHATRQTTLLNLGKQQRVQLGAYMLKCAPAMQAAARLELEGIKLAGRNAAQQHTASEPEPGEEEAPATNVAEAVAAVHAGEEVCPPYLHSTVLSSGAPSSPCLHHATCPVSDAAQMARAHTAS